MDTIFPAKRSIYTTTLLGRRESAMFEPNSNPYSASPNAASFKRSKPPPSPIIVPASHVAFRLLCHASRIGGVIGKSGAIIKQLQHATSAKIRVEETPYGSDDRVIVIVASNSVNRKIALSGSNEDAESSKEVEVSSAQEALVRVFERIVDVAAEIDGLAAVTGGLVSCRLLTEANQAGSVIGKGGKIVENIRKDSGCKIKVLKSNKLPSCTLPTEEIVEIEGNIVGIKKALVAVSRRLQDSLTPDRTLQALEADNINRFPSMEFRAPPPSPQQEVVFRMLCSVDRVGGLIGKGGSIIRAIQSETGTSIVIGNSLIECDERLITITCVENADSQYSSAQKAADLVFNRCVEAGIENGVGSGSSPVSVRLVVSSNQIGCLLGKGGSIVSEMRRLTGTSIRVIKCSSEKDEIVQITGELVNVRDALRRVTSRLRENLFPSKIGESNPYGRARDPPFYGSSGGIPYNSRNQHKKLSESMDHLGLSHNLERRGGGLHPRSVLDVGRGSDSVKGRMEPGSGNRSAIVTNTTVEIAVPENIISSVYGENGSNLTRLRQISGAKVVVHEARAGTSDRMVVISGTPDETQAAQSLLHAFILSGSSSS